MQSFWFAVCNFGVLCHVCGKYCDSVQTFYMPLVCSQSVLSTRNKTTKVHKKIILRPCCCTSVRLSTNVNVACNFPSKQVGMHVPRAKHFQMKSLDYLVTLTLWPCCRVGCECFRNTSLICLWWSSLVLLNIWRPSGSLWKIGVGTVNWPQDILPLMKLTKLLFTKHMQSIWK